MVRKVASKHAIKSVMTFGGEPLLYPDDVCMIHSAARDAGIAVRQLITNGFFSRDEAKIKKVVSDLAESGVNDLLLSVDAFHQEFIPLEPVVIFAKAALEMQIPSFRVHPAWLGGRDADNPYNRKTHEILSVFNEMGIPSSDGNVIFAAGNALKYLSEYFNSNEEYENEYTEKNSDIVAISVEPNGDVLDGNIYKSDIIDILQNCVPDDE
ncbi:MAG: radical SAM protein [Eubacteriales bacterium]|jgi:hypothetical protein|nr:radical SAM protein [Clostridiales bacterium]